MTADLMGEMAGRRTDDMAVTTRPRTCRQGTLELLLRAHEVGQAGVLLAVATVTHVVIGASAIAVPGSVSAASVNAALLAGMLVGAAVTFACSTPTPWWAWSSRRRAAFVTAAPLGVACVAMAAVASAAEVVTGRPALAGWCGSVGTALLVLSVLPRPALASMVASAVGIAVVALVPGEAPGAILGLSAATWYDSAPPLGSGGTPFALLLVGVTAVVVRGLITGRTIES
jgi:hypothetical protein